MFHRLASIALGLILTGLLPVAVGAQPGTPALPPQPKVHPAGIPAGYVLVSPCVRGMGEHWANPKNLELPIYGTYEGKVVFSEIMIPKSAFAKGFNYSNLRALPGHSIDHVDIEYHPHGHAGMMIPHYDIHAYYVSHASHLKFCPNGIPDSDNAALKR